MWLDLFFILLAAVAGSTNTPKVKSILKKKISSNLNIEGSVDTSHVEFSRDIIKDLSQAKSTINIEYWLHHWMFNVGIKRKPSHQELYINIEYGNDRSQRPLYKKEKTHKDIRMLIGKLDRYNNEPPKPGNLEYYFYLTNFIYSTSTHLLENTIFIARAVGNLQYEDAVVEQDKKDAATKVSTHINRAFIEKYQLNKVCVEKIKTATTQDTNNLISFLHHHKNLPTIQQIIYDEDKCVEFIYQSVIKPLDKNKALYKEFLDANDINELDNFVNNDLGEQVQDNINIIKQEWQAHIHSNAQNNNANTIDKIQKDEAEKKE